MLLFGFGFLPVNMLLCNSRRSQVLIHRSKTCSSCELVLSARIFQSLVLRKFSTSPVLHVLQTADLASWLVFPKESVVILSSRDVA